MNQLFYGDNLRVLRDSVATESVDLIYLDPPFNSKRDYNLLFKSPKAPASGENVYSEAQIEAFLDTWHWTAKGAEREFDEIIKGPNTGVSEMLQALVKFLGRNDMTAYLVMMASRLLELHRVLKPTGSLYLHCDPTASAYLRIVLDAVFGKENFRSEIAWRRSGAHNDANRYGANHDVVFFYSRGSRWTWNQQYAPYSEAYVKQNYRYRDEKGLFRVSDLTANKPGGDVSYEWTTPSGQTVSPYKGRFWAYSKENMQKMQDAGLLFYRQTGMPVLKHYLDEMPGVPLQTFWHDLPPIISGSPEDLGYPTQKPLALLERIIKASSNPGDVVLDPFCGCGTAVHAAQKLGRHWIGVDITCLAIALIESRLKKAFPEAFGQTDKRRLQFKVIGTPEDLESARDLARRDKYQFQWWAVSLIDEAQPWQGKKKGADTGIDGVRYFRDLDRKEVHTVLLSIKGGDNVGPAMVKDLIATLARDKADIGLFITLAAPTRAMTTEAAAAGFYQSPNGKKYPRLQLLTIAGLLDGSQRAEHPDYEPDLGYKKARAETSGEQSAFF